MNIEALEKEGKRNLKVEGGRGREGSSIHNLS